MAGTERGQAETLVQLERDLDEARAQVLATNEILTAIGRSASDLDSVLSAVVDSARRLCHADVSQIHLAADDHFRMAAAVGHSDEYQDFMDRHSITIDRRTLIGRVGLDRRAQQLADVLADPDYGRQDVQAIAGFRTILGVPMLFDDELIGVVSAWRTEVAPFAEREVEILTAFAAQAAVAIRNVDLLCALEARQEELGDKVEQLEALGEIGQAVSSSLDPDQVLATIIDKAVHLADADGGSVFEYDAESRSFQVRTTIETTDEMLESLQELHVGLDDSLLGRSALEQRPQQVADLQGSELQEGELDAHLSLLATSGWRSVVAVPILRENRILGALTLRSLSPGRFPEEICDLLETFASQSALAIVNAGLFRELERRGMELEVVSQHKSEFLASMSHELRTPLNAVIGFSEVLLERMFGDLNERQEDYLRDILDSGRHLLELLNEILDLSKVEAGHMELDRSRFPLRELLADSVMMVHALAEQRGLHLDLEVGEGVDLVTADPLRLKQVVLNLLSNAVRFARHRVALRATSDGPTITVSVVDDGPGIPEEDRERIFEAFQQGGRGAPKEEGTGLGLTLCRRMVELHGGQIGVESELGQGSTFTFTIPVAAAGPGPEPRADAGVSRSTSPIVVIVEDDRRSLELLSLYLEDAGAEVVTARDGQAGLELIRRVHPAAVVLDIRLPKLDGWDLLALLKADATTAPIPVVVVSMLDERGKGFALGAAEYLVKPVGREAVRAALGRVAALPGDERTVLCVESDPGVQELIRSTLELEGWLVLGATTADEGIDLARSRRPAVVVLDLLISGGDGLTVAEALKADAATAAIPVILVTSHPLAPADKERLRGRIAYAATHGTFDPGALAELVRTAAARGHNVVETS